MNAEVLMLRGCIYVTGSLPRDSPTMYLPSEMSLYVRSEMSLYLRSEMSL